MNIPEMQSDDLCNDLCIGGGTGGGGGRGGAGGSVAPPPYFLWTHVTTDQLQIEIA